MHIGLPLRAKLLIAFLGVTLLAGVVGFMASQAINSDKGLIIMAIAILGTLVSILVGVIFALSITNSLRKLREGTIRFSNGDFSRRIELNRRDEIGQLVVAFNQMADRLRESYQRLAFENQRDETLLESMGEGIVVADEKGVIIHINNKALTMLERTSDDVLGKPIQKAFAIYDNTSKPKPIHAADRPEVRALRTSKPQTEVLALPKKEGKPTIVNVDANPIVVEERSEGVIVVLRDVTKEKEVDRMKTEFISLASHQLRTPLSAIKWFTEMLLSGDAGKLKSEQLEFTKNISDSTQRMIELVSSLLNISRIESGRIIIDPKPTNLEELVRGIVNDLKAKIEERQQNLIISVHKDLPKINLDAHLIGQVYLNLLTNAIKYTPKGGEITVFVSRKDDQVVSQVTDNGYGIPKQQQDRVFQKFFRAQNAVKVETDGTGLGLYLIKAVVESSGGKLWFESEEGKGTTFWFSLPLSGMKAKAGEVTLDS